MNKPIRWADLTQQERDKFGNGCGPKWIPAPVTKVLFGWMFDASCRRHDFGYSRGGTDEDRKAVDSGFYRAMKKDIKRLPLIAKPVAHVVAGAFYGFVRIGGWLHFDKGEYKSKDEILGEG